MQVLLNLGRVSKQCFTNTWSISETMKRGDEGPADNVACNQLTLNTVL